MIKADLALIFPPKENFWPLDSYNISLMPFIGKPLFMRIAEHVLNFVQIQKLFLLHYGDLNKKALNGINFCKDLEILQLGLDTKATDLLEYLKSLVAERLLLAFLACDLGILTFHDFDELLHESSIYVEEDTEKILNARAAIRENSRVSPNIVYVNASKERVILYPWDFLPIVQYVLDSQVTERYISPEAKISESVNIVGPCHIDSGAQILEGAVIKGPCYIGRGVLVGNYALVRNSIIEANSIIGAYMEVARSWLGMFSETHSGYIGDSIFSERVHVGAGFITANVRLDRQEIRVKLGTRRLNTGLKKFGTIIGCSTEIGIHSGTMPGVLIGKNVRIGPGTLIFDNVPDGAVVYTTQQIRTLKND
ncbi:MAG: hypothetical protein QXY55_03120 [Candidatus Korarchaeota archaeon]|nr:hypothetical protein [Thermoproteota archaeon]MCR8501179.1 hypothetical protein [Thermoproteota archaeon]